MERLRLYATLFLGLIAILIFRYNALWSKFRAYRKPDGAADAPPLYPYFFPLLGSLPFAYLWNPRTFVLSPRYVFLIDRVVASLVLLRCSSRKLTL